VMTEEHAEFAQLLSSEFFNLQRRYKIRLKHFEVDYGITPEIESEHLLDIATIFSNAFQEVITEGNPVALFEEYTSTLAENHPTTNDDGDY